MRELKSFDPNAEVVGDVILGFIDAFPRQARDVALKLLDWNGICGAEIGKYYPLKSFLDAMQDISETFGSSMLFVIGERFAMDTDLPLEIRSLEDCLSSLDRAYRNTHKGKEIGYYEFVDLGVQGQLSRVKMVCRTPYPRAFERGMIEGFVRRFRPQGTGDGIFVSSDQAEPRSKNGNECRTYIISWLLSLEPELENLFALEKLD